MLIHLLLSILLSSQIVSAEKKGVMIEALLGSVGDKVVQYSDLIRYQSVDQIMHCAKIRSSDSEITQDVSLAKLLRQYVDEELIYLEARIRIPGGSGAFRKAIEKIKKAPICRKEWRTMGNRYSALWSSNRRPRAGEGMLVRELEKRLLVDLYIKTRIAADKISWLQEARVRHPIELYLE